jgi:hypothetical protein
MGVRVDYLFLKGKNVKVATHGDVPTNVSPMAGLLVEIDSIFFVRIIHSIVLKHLSKVYTQARTI